MGEEGAESRIDAVECSRNHAAPLSGLRAANGRGAAAPLCPANPVLCEATHRSRIGSPSALLALSLTDTLLHTFSHFYNCLNSLFFFLNGVPYLAR